MFATGMGIFAHIPYIQALLDGYKASRIRTGKIKILWHIAHPNCSKWVSERMQGFLQQNMEDEGRDRLEVSLRSILEKIRSPYCGQFFHITIVGSRPTEKLGRRVEWVSGRADWGKAIHRELEEHTKDRRGKLAVSGMC